MTRILPFVLLIAAAVVLAGCGRNKEPATAGATSPVTVEAAANATYATENTASGSMQLRDGHYEDSDRTVVDLDAMTAVGDLDGDGNDDRVVLMVTGTGGSGVFHELYVLRHSNGVLLVSTPALLGDRVVVNELHIERGDIVVSLVVQGADDPLCCPTQPVVYRFRLADNALVETTGQQRVYLGE